MSYNKGKITFKPTSERQRLVDVFTALSPFYVTLNGGSLLDNAVAYCPEQPHDKDTVLYEYPTITL